MKVWHDSMTVAIVERTQLQLLPCGHVAPTTQWGTEPRAPNSKLRALSIGKHSHYQLIILYVYWRNTYTPTLTYICL